MQLAGEPRKRILAFGIRAMTGGAGRYLVADAVAIDLFAGGDEIARRAAERLRLRFWKVSASPSSIAGESTWRTSFITGLVRRCSMKACSWFLRYSGCWPASRGIGTQPRILVLIRRGRSCSSRPWPSPAREPARPRQAREPNTPTRSPPRAALKSELSGHLHQRRHATPSACRESRRIWRVKIDRRQFRWSVTSVDKSLGIDCAIARRRTFAGGFCVLFYTLFRCINGAPP